MNDTPKRLSTEQIQAMFDKSPFISTLGLVLLSLDYEALELTVKMPPAPDSFMAAPSPRSLIQ